MRQLLAPIFALVAIILLLSGPSPPSARAQPQVTLIFPEDGSVLAEPPSNIHLCFAEPVDNADDADFRFKVLTPEGRGLGLRIVFQRDGLGVDVQPGLPDPAPQGEWTFEWRVSDAATKAPASGTLHFKVAPTGDDIPAEAPQRCIGTEGTSAPAEASQATTTEDSEDGGPTALAIVLIVVGAIAAVAAGTILLVRRHISSWLRRSPPSDDGDGPAP